ncbi:MAG: glutamate--cysteine ligase [Armatimonadetes bacterium]|nr:glutamate--cysteine ligase [Armatimonadota bacterium]
MPGLLKGFEIELFTGRPDGEVVGLADHLARRMDGFVLEPDSRNLEYVTAPLADYRALLSALVEPRLKLREVLAEMGGYTIVPGSTMPLAGATGKFIRSDPGNPYHDQIEKTYGTRVVTASVHINFGLPYAEDVILATRLLRMDAAVVLAVSAASPFLEGAATGAHSTRWETFPLTPDHVPLFVDHADYADWMRQQLSLGLMWNVRHLWVAARPNGPDRPDALDRVELRICDLIYDPRVLLGLTLALEVRLDRMLRGKLVDTLAQKRFSADDLVAIARQNERNAARHSLDALVVDWESGESLPARVLAKRWVDEARISSLTLTAFDEWLLRGVDQTLDGGNEAMRWLSLARNGHTVPQVVEEAVAEALEIDERLRHQFFD